MQYWYVPDPHPHLVVEELVPTDAYSSMRFPDALVSPGAPWGITADDPAYAEVLRDPSWRMVHDTFRGEAFTRAVLDSFAADMRRAGCLVDPERTRLVPFVETREEKDHPILAADGDPNELFARLDFQSKAYGGYREFVHLDWARRIVGGILFFSGSKEEGFEGVNSPYFAIGASPTIGGATSRSLPRSFRRGGTAA